METVKIYVKLIRMRHYIKNFLVFAALGCSGQLFCRDKLIAAFLGFSAFCAVSSVIYIINDIQDQEKDKLHPAKRDRPIASGKVSVRTAWIAAIFMLAVGVFFNSMVFHMQSAVLLLLYLLLNLVYSLGVKNVPLLDTAILTAGFLIRAMYGALVTEVVISEWLYLTVIAAAFFFALGKRRNELRRISSQGETRMVLKYYSVDFLDKNMYMCLTLVNAFYALWCADEDTSSHYGVNLVFTIPMVLLITMRYSMDVEGDSDGDPVEVLLRDRILMVLCLSYFMIMFMILYF